MGASLDVGFKVVNLIFCWRGGVGGGGTLICCLPQLFNRQPRIPFEKELARGPSHHSAFPNLRKTLILTADPRPVVCMSSCRVLPPVRPFASEKFFVNIDVRNEHNIFRVQHKSCKTRSTAHTMICRIVDLQGGWEPPAQSLYAGEQSRVSDVCDPLCYMILCVRGYSTSKHCELCYSCGPFDVRS